MPSLGPFVNRHNLHDLPGKAVGRVRDIFWEVYGRTIPHPRLRQHPRSIVFVCKGNICRSPFAQHLAEKMFHARGHDVTVDSAGIVVPTPLPSPREACTAAAAFGLDLSAHRSKPFVAENYTKFDIIAVMEVAQRNRIAKDYPRFEHRLFLLPLFEYPTARTRGYERYNLADPYGQSLEGFHRCFWRIERCLTGMARIIETL